MKRYSTLLFSAKFSLVEEQGLEKRKFRKLFGKGRRRRKMSRIGFKISQKLFKEVQKFSKDCEMQVKVLLLYTLHVWSRKPLEKL